MTQKFSFTSWIYRDISVYSTELLDDLVECGLDIPMAPPIDHKSQSDVEKLKKFLDRALELGVKMILSTPFGFDSYKSMGEDAWIRELREFYEVTLGRHPAIYGICIGDEPWNPVDLDAVKNVIIKVKQNIPGLMPYINFTGGTGAEFGTEMFGGKTLAEWLSDIKEQAGEFYLTFDLYSQMINNNGGTTEYFKQMKANVDACEAAGLVPGVCLICSAHYAYHAPNYYDIVWQISTAAACGNRSINWFRFCDSPIVPNYHASPIDEYGEKTSHYYDMKRATKRFLDQYGEIFMKLKRKSTYLFGEDKGRDAYPRFENGVHEIIQQVRCFEESLISFFEHEETGEEYFCIVNLSREHYEHYEMICDTEKYEIHDVFANGARGDRIDIGDLGDADWEGEWLYPGQLGLFRIKRK